METAQELHEDQAKNKPSYASSSRGSPEGYI